MKTVSSVSLVLVYKIIINLVGYPSCSYCRPFISKFSFYLHIINQYECFTLLIVCEEIYILYFSQFMSLLFTYQKKVNC